VEARRSGKKELRSVAGSARPRPHHPYGAPRPGPSARRRVRWPAVHLGAGLSPRRSLSASADYTQTQLTFEVPFLRKSTPTAPNKQPEAVSIAALYT